MPAHFDTDAENAKLASLREKEEEDLARILSSRYGLSYADLSISPINMDALRLVPEAKARAADMAVFDKVSKKLSIALRNPQNPALADVFKELESLGYQLEKHLVSAQSLARALDRYKDLSFAHVSAEGVFDISGDDIDVLKKDFSSLASLKTHLDEVLSTKKLAQVSRVFEDIIAAALSMEASDIHIEPEEHEVKLRLRLDGLLQDAYELDAKTYRSVASRVKLLSGLKLNVENRAQDGRFTIAIQGTEIEVRTSVIPGNYGEAIVLRILDPEAINRTLEQTGIHPKLLERLLKEVHKPNGMLLTTGPTGSGKTTTLYTFLRKLQTPDIKIVTIEDPIEYHLPGIVQTQVDNKDYTFASGLRSILRQDPDVILVGEIRDKEVAEVATQAALTGHFVFSTLHTNNAAGTFPRLVDLGVDPKLFASAVSVAMAQRLARTLNQETKKPRAATPEEQALMKKVMESVADRTLLPTSYDTLYEGDYKGRVGLHEAIFMDDALGEFLRDNPSESDIAKRAVSQGYLTMAQDGVLKALAGLTTLEELQRVVELS